MTTGQQKFKPGDVVQTKGGDHMNDRRTVAGFEWRERSNDWWYFNYDEGWGASEDNLRLLTPETDAQFVESLYVGSDRFKKARLELIASRLREVPT